MVLLGSIQQMQLSVLLVVLSSLLSISESFPQYLIKSAKGKCFTVIAPHNTKLIVNYEAPGKSWVCAIAGHTVGISHQLLHNLIQWLIDIVFDKKNPAYAASWITIASRQSKKSATDYKFNPQEWKKQFKSEKHAQSGKPTTIELSSTIGSVEHTTILSGEVQVCFRPSGASSIHPMRFGLQVDKEDEVHAHEDLGNTFNLTATDHHLTHMEVEMKHLVVSMKNILHEADYGKDREMAFHEKTLSMHAASMWWPIVQLSVLMLTGFTQVNHMVRFFQRRRIV